MSFDLDAAVRESLGTPFTFKLGGKEFTLPHQKDVDKSSLVLADGNPGQYAMDSLRIALGDQWDAFDEIALSVSGVDKLYAAWNEHCGVEAGESQASTRS